MYKSHLKLHITIINFKYFFSLNNKTKEKTYKFFIKQAKADDKRCFKTFHIILFCKRKLQIDTLKPAQLNSQKN